MVNKEGLTLGVLVGVVGVMLLFMLGVALPALTGYWSFGSFGRTSVPSSVTNVPIGSASSDCTMSKALYYLNTGESVVVGGKTVTLKGCATAKASVDVGGVTDVINKGNQMTLNGLKVKVYSVEDYEGIVYDSAVLIFRTGC